MMTPSGDVAQGSPEWETGAAHVVDLDADTAALARTARWGFEADELLTKAEYLTKAQAGAIVQLHPKTIERAIMAGELPAYKLRERVRISRDDLNAWVSANEIEPAPGTHDI